MKEFIKLMFYTIPVGGSALSPFLILIALDRYNIKNKIIITDPLGGFADKEIEETVNLIHNLKLKVPID